MCQPFCGEKKIRLAVKSGHVTFDLTPYAGATDRHVDSPINFQRAAGTVHISV